MDTEKLSRNVAISRKKRLMFPAAFGLCKSSASPICHWLVEDQYML